MFAVFVAVFYFGLFFVIASGVGALNFSTPAVVCVWLTMLIAVVAASIFHTFFSDEHGDEKG